MKKGILHIAVDIFSINSSICLAFSSIHFTTLPVIPVSAKGKLKKICIRLFVFFV